MNERVMFAVGATLFVAGAVAGGVVVYLLHDETDGDTKPTPAAFSEVKEVRAGELAEQFRPWLKFDGGEHWRPLSVAHLLAERREGVGAHLFCAPKPCEPIEGNDDFADRTRADSSLGQETFVDIAGEKGKEYRSTHRCEGRLYDCSTGGASAIYYHVTFSNDRYYVDYWWFLRYNNFERSVPRATCAAQATREAEICGEHEGDWEGVTVVTRPGSTTEPDYVVYAAHSGTFRYAAAQLEFWPGTTRPEVYVARGSHASYPRACSGRCKQPIALEGLVNLPEGNSDGEADWVRNDDNCKANAPASCLLELPRTDRNPRAWTVWSGRWGAGCQQACRGKPGPKSPSSPGLQPRYQTPWCSTQRGVLTCDGRALGCTDWLGPLVVAVACDPDLVAEGLADPTKQQAGRLALTVRDEERNRESTPGIVQALGSPLQPGDTMSLTGGGPGVQLLVRAQDGRFVVEARFGRAALEAGKRTTVTVTKGPKGPVVLAGEHQPVERRVLEIESGS